MEFQFRKAGPSGRGEDRIRYYVDVGTPGKGIGYLGTIEGKSGNWTTDEGCGGVQGKSYSTRKAAALALVDSKHL